MKIRAIKTEEDYQKALKRLEKSLKSIYIILLAALTLISCKEKCGCDSEPYKTVSNIEAIFKNGDFLLFSEYDATICNIEMVPEEILFLSEESGREGIDVIISGDLHKWCAVTPSFITLTDIKLPEK